MLTTPLLLTLSATTILAQDIPSPLLPWQITGLSTHSPLGRPGNSPYSSLFVAITDPNTIPFPAPASFQGPAISLDPISANCSVKWNAYSEQPFGWLTLYADVAPASGRWTVDLFVCSI